MMSRSFYFQRGSAVTWSLALLIAAAPVPALSFTPAGQLGKNLDQDQQRVTRPAAKQQAGRAKSKDRFVDNSTQRSRRRVARRQVTQEALFILRLLRLPPDKRQRVVQQNLRFQNLPSAQRQRIENRIQHLNQLLPAEHQQVLERLRLFDQLPPGKQIQARTTYRHWKQISEPRRTQLLEEFDSIRDVEPQARKERFDSREFRRRYSAQEQNVLKGFSDLLEFRRNYFEQEQNVLEDFSDLLEFRRHYSEQEQNVLKDSSGLLPGAEE